MGLGMIYTAMPVTNAVPAVVAAEPGIATLADLPVVTGRAGSEGAAGHNAFMEPLLHEARDLAARPDRAAPRAAPGARARPATCR